MPQQILKDAIALAEQGIHVFPVWGAVEGHCSCGKLDCSSPGKHPCVRSWTKQATCDPAAVARLWNNYPGNGIGIAAGQSGLSVLDVDPKNGGFENLKLLRRKCPQLTDALDAAPMVESGSGGFHWYFRLDGVSNTSNRIAQGIDTRGKGGYIIAPPSSHISGKQYKWIRPLAFPLVRFPADLWERITQSANSKNQKLRNIYCLDAEIIPEGSRNSALLSYAGKLRYAGIPEATTVTVLKSLRDKHCENPETVPDRELERIASSVWKYPARIDLFRYAKWWLEQGLSGAEFRFLLGLAIDKGQKIPNPSVKRLRETTGLAESTIYFVRADLAQKKIIKLRPGKPGTATTSGRPATIEILEPPPSLKINDIVKIHTDQNNYVTSDKYNDPSPCSGAVHDKYVPARRACIDTSRQHTPPKHGLRNERENRGRLGQEVSEDAE